MKADYLSGNRIDLLETGAQYFPALVAAIDAAVCEIHLETYIFADDPAGGMEAAFVTRDNLRHRRDIEEAYLDAIANAHTEIFLANAYFLPGRRFRRALRAAASAAPVRKTQSKSPVPTSGAARCSRARCAGPPMASFASCSDSRATAARITANSQ